MNWFFLALIPPALWAVSNHIDKFLIMKHIKGSSVGALAIVSSVTALILLPFIAIFHPQVLSINSATALFLMLNGGFAVTGLLFYFFALEKEDASVVVPLFEMIPIFTLLLGFLILGERLAGAQVNAFFIILFGSILISLDLDKKFSLKWNVFFLMVASCIINSLYAVIIKKFALETNYWQAMFWSQAGLFIAGVIMLAFIRSYRRDFLILLNENRDKIIGLNITNEIINTVAVLLSAYTLLLAPVALVSVVGSFQAVFVFVFGVVLTVFMPHISEESLVKKHLLQRITAIIIILVGSYLLNLAS